MLQMLAEGGMPILTDGIRGSDEDNPRGYFEFEPVKRTKSDASWLVQAQGKAVKMVYLLLRDLPAGYRYHVIMMRRDLGEVLASQRKMLERSRRTGASVSDQRLAEIYAQQLESIGKWMALQANFSTLEVNHRDCLERPRAVAARVNDFLGNGLDEARMAGIIDAGLYRNRS